MQHFKKRINKHLLLLKPALGGPIIIDKQRRFSYTRLNEKQVLINL
jgi:hypothetical protein